MAATVYRWWPSKADVLLDALGTKADLYVPTSDKDSYSADLHAFLTETFALGRKPQVADVLRALMAEAQINAGFGERFRSSFLQRRRDALRIILDRAQARGDLPPSPPPGTVTDIIFGTLWYRLLATRQPVDQQLVDDLVSRSPGHGEKAASGELGGPSLAVRRAAWNRWTALSIDGQPEPIMSVGGDQQAY